MKKKIISLVFGMFMAVFSVFSLSSCSVVSKNTGLENKKTVVKVGDVSLSKADVISSFYTYYQNNSSYFSYYDNETIEESFYTWAIIKELISQKSETSLYDAETNPNGFIVYTEENEKNVWKSTYEYLYSQVSSYETAIYTSAGYADENLPAWLSAEEEETAASEFEAYKSTMPGGVTLDKSKAVKPSTDEQIVNRINSVENNLKKYLFEHLVETDENGNETRKAINDIVAEENKYVAEIEKDKFIVNARSQAYVDYIAGLVNSAKSSGKAIDPNQLLIDEVIRVYKAYYDSEITTLLQKYYLDEYLISGENTPLTEKAIAEAFLKEYYTDYQTYQFEDSYITTMTSSDGASLVLYHYDGRDYYFTVQHILVKNDEYITKKIQKLPGYDSTGKFDYDATGADSVYQQFVNERNSLTNSYFMASAVNKDNLKDSIVLEKTSGGSTVKYANYYTYDSERTDINDGYIYVIKDGDKYYEDADNDGVADLVTPGEEAKVEVAEDDVLYLSTEEEILDCYKANYENWITWANEYAGYVSAKDEAGKKTVRDAHDDIGYVFDTVENLVNAGKSAEIKSKIASYLFIELEWIFSSDSLGNKLSNKMGYVMSNYEDDHGSWVVDFAVGARELLKNIKTSTGEDDVQAGIDALLASDNVSALTNTIISTYGYHIIKVEDIFVSGSSMVDVKAIENSFAEKKIDLNKQAHVDAIIKALQETYVCSGSNQTLYDYYFDELYTGFVGSSWLGDTSDEATSGTYFLKLEYEWLYELYQANLIEYENRMTYEELLESVS